MRRKFDVLAVFELDLVVDILLVLLACIIILLLCQDCHVSVASIVNIQQE